MDTPLPPFTPHHVRLVGHRDLGPVPARYVGCWLEIDHPEHGGRYGPAAVFRAVPVVEVVAEAKASRGALVWVQEGPSVWALCPPGRPWLSAAAYLCGTQQAWSYVNFSEETNREATINGSREGARQITTWAREDGYEVPPWPGEAKVEAVPEPVPPVERLRHKGKTVDWRHVSGDARLYSDGSDRADYLAAVDTVSERWRWCTFRSPSNLNVLSEGTAPTQALGKTAALRALIAEGVLTVEPEPAPKDRTVYDPDNVQRGDRHVLSDGTRGTVLGVIDGWIAYTDRVAMIQHSAGVVRVEPVDPDDIPW